MRGAFTEASADSCLLAQSLVEELRHPVGHLWKGVELSTAQREIWTLFHAAQLLSHHKYPPFSAFTLTVLAVEQLPLVQHQSLTCKFYVVQISHLALQPKVIIDAHRNIQLFVGNLKELT